MDRLYIVQQRPDNCYEVVAWAGTKGEAYLRGAYADTLTQAFRRARLMAGERPGLTLEEVPVMSQVPLVFLGAERG